jgi:hypothetical protein
VCRNFHGLSLFLKRLRAGCYRLVQKYNTSEPLEASQIGKKRGRARG